MTDLQKVQFDVEQIVFERDKKEPTGDFFNLHFYRCRADEQPATESSFELSFDELPALLHVKKPYFVEVFETTEKWPSHVAPDEATVLVDGEVEGLFQEETCDANGNPVAKWVHVSLLKKDGTNELRHSLHVTEDEAPFFRFGQKVVVVMRPVRD